MSLLNAWLSGDDTPAVTPAAPQARRAAAQAKADARGRAKTETRASNKAAALDRKAAQAPQAAPLGIGAWIAGDSKPAPAPKPAPTPQPAPKPAPAPVPVVPGIQAPQAAPAAPGLDIPAFLRRDNAQAPQGTAPAPKYVPAKLRNCDFQRARAGRAPSASQAAAQAPQAAPAPVAAPEAAQAPQAAPKAAQAEIITFRGTHARAIDNGTRKRITSRTHNAVPATPAAPQAPAVPLPPVQASNGLWAKDLGDGLFWVIEGEAPAGCPIAFIRWNGAEWLRVNMNAEVWLDWKTQDTAGFIAKYL